ncbi:MAG: hypothetical protein ABW250_06925 [Pyrinomonadaceae bacterium]
MSFSGGVEEKNRRNPEEDHAEKKHRQRDDAPRRPRTFTQFDFDFPRQIAPRPIT